MVVVNGFRGCFRPGFQPELIDHLRLDMDKLKSKQRAVGILLVLGSILVLIATWDLPEGWLAQER
jgi:hypothetical protein